MEVKCAKAKALSKVYIFLVTFDENMWKISECIELFPTNNCLI